MAIAVTFARSWQVIAEHTKLVIEATDALTAALALDDKYKATLHTAALWHDVGKAHEEFQKMLRNGDASATRPRTLREIKKQSQTIQRCQADRSFRHELASALAWLLNRPD